MKTPVRMKIDGLDFDIYDINIKSQYNSIGRNLVSGIESIKMVGTTSNQNYTKLDKWFSGVFSTNPLGYAKNYKKHIIYNSVQMYGVFPMEYELSQSGIQVTFSVDYINGDLKLFEIQEIRREKLKKLEKIIKEYEKE